MATEPTVKPVQPYLHCRATREELDRLDRIGEHHALGSRANVVRWLAVQEERRMHASTHGKKNS